MEAMSDLRQCPVCGARLPVDAPEGFCPRCSFGGALHAEPGETLPMPHPPGISAESSSGAGPHSPLGTQLGDYELLEEIAHGGMGIVYKARQRSLDRIVAVKTLLFGPQAQPEFVKRFRAEATAAAGLQHPKIVAIHEVGVQAGQHYFVMDYVEGQNLAELVGKAPLPAQRAARYVQQIAEAIHYAHERGILHRDLKPSNVLIDAQDQPRVTDFGLAKRFEGDSELTLSGQVVGSPGYLPPEQAEANRGKVSRRSDVYGLGAVLYHLVTARPPFQAEALTELLRQVVESEPVSPRLLNPGVPRDLETICLKCLDKEPARRYATAQAVAEELGRFLAGKPVLARPVGPTGKAWRWCQRKPILAGLGSMVLILLLVVAIGSPLALIRINRARLAAIEQTRRAEQQTRRAQAEGLKARQSEYVADMNLAQHALTLNNLGRARQLLAKHLPGRFQKSATGSVGPETDLRGWEWRYLWSLCQSDALFTFAVCSNGVGAVAFAGNGQVLAARDQTGDVTVFDLTTRQEIARLPDDSEQLRAMAVSPDGNFLAHGAAAADGTRIVALWDARARRHVGELPHPGTFVSLAFSPDGKRLVTFGEGGTARIWNLATAKVSATFPVSPRSGDHKGVVVFSPDGDTLAIGETDGRIRLLTIPSSTERANYQAHPTGDGITALAFSPDSHILASGSGYSDTTVRLWEPQNGRSLGQLTGHTAWIAALAMSADGKTLASASADQKIRLWDLDLKQGRGILQGHRYEVHALTFSLDGKRLVSGCKDGSICFWDPDAPPKPARVLSLPGPIRSLAFSPDDQTFNTLNGDGSVSLWDVANAEKTATYAGLGASNECLAISPEGKVLVTGTATGTLKVWNRLTQREMTHFIAHQGKIEHLQYRLGGRIVVSAARDMTVKLWDATSWREKSECRIDHDFWTFDCSADAALAGLANWRTLEVWDLATGRRLTRLAGDAGYIYGIAFSEDGRLLATASYGGSAAIYEVGTWREIARLRRVVGGVSSVAFSPDGDRLAAGSGPRGPVTLWDRATLQELATFPPEANTGIAFVAFSPDGSTLASINQDGTAQLRRAPSLSEIDATLTEPGP